MKAPEDASLCDASLTEQWLDAMSKPRIAAELEAIYADVQIATSERGVVCNSSGRCCRFGETGHRLYVTGLETAYLILRLNQLNDEAAHPGAKQHTTHALPILGDNQQGDRRAVLDEASMKDADERDGCPFQINNRCSAHTIRPIGCRIYYCDPTSTQWQQTLSERSLRAVRLLHDRHEAPYRYGQWRSMLRMFLSSPRESA